MKLTDFIPNVLLAGEDDAISLLINDHDNVKAQFARFKEIKDGRAVREKEEIVASVCRDLTVHTKIEEEIFYPAVRAALDEDDLMNEALVEHDGAKNLIAELENMDASDEMFDAKFTVLSEYIDHHVKEEQNDMFPKARGTDLDMQALGLKMAARKQQLMNGNHKSAGRPAVVRKRKPKAKTAASARSR